MTYHIFKDHLPVTKKPIFYVYSKEKHLGKNRFRTIQSFMDKKNAKNFRKALIKKNKDYQKALRMARRARAKTLRKMKRNGEL